MNENEIKAPKVNEGNEIEKAEKMETPKIDTAPVAEPKAPKMNVEQKAPKMDTNDFSDDELKDLDYDEKPLHDYDVTKDEGVKKWGAKAGLEPIGMAKHYAGIRFKDRYGNNYTVGVKDGKWRILYEGVGDDIKGRNLWSGDINDLDEKGLGSIKDFINSQIQESSKYFNNANTEEIDSKVLKYSKDGYTRQEIIDMLKEEGYTRGEAAKSYDTNVGYDEDKDEDWEKYF